jgi:hypothetical protein
MIRPGNLHTPHQVRAGFSGSRALTELHLDRDTDKIGMVPGAELLLEQ